MSRRNEGPKLKFLDKRSCYYIFWTENGRSRQCSTGTATFAEAEIFFAEFLQNRTRKLGPRDPSEVLITDILTDYLKRLVADHKDTSRAAYATAPMSEYFAGRTLSQAPSLTEGFSKWRNVSSSTVRRDLGVLQSAIKQAFASQIITRMIIIQRPPESAPRERWLNRSEAAVLLAGALGFAPIAFDAMTRKPSKWRRDFTPQYHLARFILIGIYTGRRKEAILSLRWNKVDMVRKTIDFRRDGIPENNKKRGQIPIPSRLYPHLKRARKHERDVGHVITWEGKPIKDLKTTFNTCAERVGLNDVTPHTLKHTTATWLFQAGWDVFKISGFLSTTVQTLLKTYGHHNPDHQKEIANAIGARPGNVRRLR